MMKSRFRLTAGLFLLLSAAMVRAQTAAELETILDTQEISYAQTAYFALASAGSPSPNQAGPLRWPWNGAGCPKTPKPMERPGWPASPCC